MSEGPDQPPVRVAGIDPPRSALYAAYSWAVVVAFVTKYFAYRLGLAKRPRVDPIVPNVTAAIGPLVGVPKRLRVRGAEHFPKSGPAIVCCNHIRLDDPLVLYHACRRARGDPDYHPRSMMRDDYFAGPLFENRLVKAIDFFECLGAYGISRDHVGLKQLKPFLRVLEAGETFILFPGRTRSRSGVFIEYRDDFDGPGGVSFFVHQSQRRNPGLSVPVVPAARTYNPVDNTSVIVFGPPLTLPPNVTREEQRAFDFRVIEAMGGLVELQMVHVIAGVLFLSALHRCSPRRRIDDLTDAARNAFLGCDYPLRNPGDVADPAAAAVKALAYFLRYRVLSLKDAVCSRCDARILANADLNAEYRHKSPVKYLVNQILHLNSVIPALDGAVQRPDLT